MRKRFKLLCFLLVLLTVLTFPVYAESGRLVAVGRTVGLELALDGVYVVKFDADKGAAPAQEAGIKIGDQIVSVNGTALRRSEELRNAIIQGHGADLIFRVRRGEKDMSFTVRPTYAGTAWRIGIYVQDRIAGLGTVTYYNPETGRFGALGHGVNTAGFLPAVRSGSATESEITSVQKGKTGRPGELLGSSLPDEPIGLVDACTDRGIFGHSDKRLQGSDVAVAEREEITTGPAEILCNVAGTSVQAYSVEIEGLSFGSEACKNLRLHITDPALLEQTGGIVQGMSGSPILQNGKLIGAVTHVLVQDPTRGYGIYIRNMLSAEEGSPSETFDAEALTDWPAASLLL